VSAPNGVALLVIDVQNDILDLYGRTPWMEQVIGNVAGLVRWNPKKNRWSTVSDIGGNARPIAKC
jgi:nicotinamidase-related amidase